MLAGRGRRSANSQRGGQRQRQNKQQDVEQHHVSGDVAEHSQIAQVHACHPARLDQTVDQPRADRCTEIDRQPGGPPLAPCAFGHGQHPADEPGEDQHHQQHRRANDGVGGGVRPAGEGVPEEGARGGRAGGNAHGDEIPGEHERDQDADRGVRQEQQQRAGLACRLGSGCASGNWRSLRLAHVLGTRCLGRFWLARGCGGRLRFHPGRLRLERHGSGLNLNLNLILVLNPAHTHRHERARQNPEKGQRGGNRDAEVHLDEVRHDGGEQHQDQQLAPAAGLSAGAAGSVLDLALAAQQQIGGHIHDHAQQSVPRAGRCPPGAGCRRGSAGRSRPARRLQPATRLNRLRRLRPRISPSQRSE